MAEQTTTARVERIEPAVWTPKAKLYIPNDGEEVAFVHPSFGPGNYKAVGQQILEKIPGKDLSVPTGEPTATLLHTSYCDSAVAEEPEFQNVRQRTRSNWLWVFNRNIFTDKGVYVIQDLEATGISGFDLNELESMLTQEQEGIRFSEDRSVRFAPKSTYTFGDHTPDSLAKDGFVRASYWFEGAEQLGEVAGKLRYGPRTYGIDVNRGENPAERVSALGEGGGRLFVDGDFGGYGRGRAFGVLNSCEAGAKN